MAVHLPVCPASVVHCSEEWSRWSMYARDQGVRLPLPQTKTYIDCGQLDIGLAMRDQRMLIDSLRAPKKLRHSLRNALTQKYPAAPLTSNNRSVESDIGASSDTSHTISDDEKDAPWDLTKPPPGLRESIRSKLFLVTKETTDKLAAALNKSATLLSSSSNSLSGVHLTEEAGDQVQSCEINFRSSSLPPDHTFSKRSTEDFACNSLANAAAPPYIQSETAMDHKDSQSSLSFNTTMCQSSESCETKSTYSETVDNCKEEILRAQEQDMTETASTEKSVSSRVSPDRVSDVSSRSRSTLHDIGGTQLHKLLQQEIRDGDGENGSEHDQSSTQSEICLHKVLGVNIGFECINKYVYKPPCMYNFICAQNFRRDQFPWHFKNVHQEIYQGSQGWMEERCPLAYMGCTFSFRRLEPAQPGMEIYHSWLLESFGLRSVDLPASVVPCGGSSTNQNTHHQTPPSGVATAVSLETHQEQDSRDLQKPPDCDQETFATSQSNVSSTNNFEDENSRAVASAEPSLSNLALADKDFDLLPQTSYVNNKKNQSCKDNKQTGTSEEPHQDKNNFINDNTCNNQTTEESGCQSTPAELVSSPKLRMRVRPTIYTAMNWDSKVLFEYEVEEVADSKELDAQLGISSLPFEILQIIAKHLDSFSLCNLALTSRWLRDVCCSLLDEHGIVLLNWQRHWTGSGVSWKVANKRWMFSTSFEPIRSWRFRSNVPHMGDHLKVCPFNKDIQRHTEKIQVMDVV
ncbi:F-box only protein [Elysia marginata]|uniref:F-box only protein n=1 Tax=Elysia marginata TaxID=1093978 RepID=A0AAV4J3E6_9GAST|nr:F-box only protein [Elysia marginata]